MEEPSGISPVSTFFYEVETKKRCWPTTSQEALPTGRDFAALVVLVEKVMFIIFLSQGLSFEIIFFNVVLSYNKIVFDIL